MKNGVAFGEAVVVLKPGLAARAPYLRKTRLQLASKMRFISAQYEAYLSTGAWERNAKTANSAARRLEAAVRTIGGIELAFPVDVNALFAQMPARGRRSRPRQILLLRLGRRPPALDDELRHDRRRCRRVRGHPPRFAHRAGPIMVAASAWDDGKFARLEVTDKVIAWLAASEQVQTK